jgi:hypothetical protein
MTIKLTRTTAYIGTIDSRFITWDENNNDNNSPTPMAKNGTS